MSDILTLAQSWRVDSILAETCDRACGFPSLVCLPTRQYVSCLGNDYEPHLVERYRLKMNCLAVFLLHSSWSRKMDNILSISVLRSTRHLVWDSMRYRFPNRFSKNTVKL